MKNSFLVTVQISKKQLDETFEKQFGSLSKRYIDEMMVI
jgi:hypothetical protein